MKNNRKTLLSSLTFIILGIVILVVSFEMHTPKIIHKQPTTTTTKLANKHM